MIVTMRELAQTLLRIIDDVLDFSKIEAGRLELEAISFSLSGLVEAVLDTLRPQVLAKGLTLYNDDTHAAIACDMLNPAQCPEHCFDGAHSPWPRPFAPPTPQRIAPLCSSASQLLWRSPTSHARASPDLQGGC